MKKELLKIICCPITKEPLQIIDKDLLEKLNELNTDKVDPLTSIIDASLKSRPDEAKNEKIRDQILKNSPEKNQEFFVVPKVIE